MLYGRYHCAPSGPNPIPEAINNLFTYTPVYDYGIKNGDDITQVVSTFNGNVGFKQGRYHITGNCEINVPVTCAGGAVFDIAANCTVTFNCHFWGDPVRAFDGAGNVRFRANNFVLPEWFGATPYNKETGVVVDSSAAIQRAVDALEAPGTILLSVGGYEVKGDWEEYGPDNGAYFINEPVNINKSVSIQGVSSFSKIFTTNNTAFNVGNGAFVESVNIQQVMLYDLAATDQHSAIEIDGAARSSIRDCRIVKYRVGVKYKNTVNMVTENVEIMPALHDNTGTVAGFYLDSSERQGGGLSPNASIRFRGCLVNFYLTPGDCYGWLVDGDDQRDIFIDDCETAAGNGVWLVNGTKFGMDVHINNLICDQFYSFGVKIEKTKHALIDIVGGYFSGSSTSDQGILVWQSSGVTVSNVQFQGDTGTKAFYSGVLINDSYACAVNGCSFLNCKNGVRVVDSVQVSVSGNVFNLESNAMSQATYDNGIVVSGNAYATIANNVFYEDADAYGDYDVDTASASTPCVIAVNTFSAAVNAKPDDVIGLNLGV